MQKVNFIGPFVRNKKDGLTEVIPARITSINIVDIEEHVRKCLLFEKPKTYRDCEFEDRFNAKVKEICLELQAEGVNIYDPRKTQNLEAVLMDIHGKIEKALSLNDEQLQSNNKWSFLYDNRN